MAIVSNKRVTGSPNIHYYDEDNVLSENAFRVGDLVKLNTEGELELATNATILGIALKSATGTTDTSIPVDVLRPGDEFSTVWGSGSTAELNLNAVLDFSFTSGSQTVATGSNDAIFVDFDDPVGTDGGRIIVTVKPTAQQFAAKAA